MKAFYSILKIVTLLINCHITVILESLKDSLIDKLENQLLHSPQGARDL